MMLKFCRAVAILMYIFVPRLVAEPNDLSRADIRSLYGELRALSLDPDNVIKVIDFLLNKDVAEFEFKSGHIYLFEPVSDRVVAAYFEGSAIFRLSTDNRIEQGQIKRFTGSSAIEQDFTQALFFFTDSTYERISASPSIDRLGVPDTVADNVQRFRQKIRERFTWNIDARILTDLARSEKDDFFSAFLECPDENEFLFIIDPLDEEEVSLLKYEKIKFSERADFETWYSSGPKRPFHGKKPQFDIQRLQMDVEIEGNRRLIVNAEMHFLCRSNQARVVPIQLEHVLRVEDAVLDDADTCLVIQEEKGEDAQLWVVFPYGLQAGKEYGLTIRYSGDGLIEDIGGDNYSIIGRTAWFPSFYTNSVDPRRFHFVFAVPEKMTLLATGKLVRTWKEDNKVYWEWDSEIEHILAGFNYGKFSVVTQRSPSCEVSCYTNEKLSDALYTVRKILEENHDLQAAFMMMPQELTTDGIGKNAAIESRNAYEVFSHFFGEIPIHKINISQQPQVSFAASWPTLIFLPFTAFFDESVRQRLFEPVIGLRSYGEWEFYHERVASHEMAHQWWAHTVMTASYHDTWLNEGFATYSEALHRQITKGVDDFKKYMQRLRRQVFLDVGDNKNLAELGPIWLGSRLSSLEAPQGKYLIYVKGAYVLHMLRMMLFDYDKKSDERFVKMMKDYVRTYTGKIATTEDFRRIVEDHLGEDMDWFFNQWVYGTDIPVYRFDYDIEEKGGDHFLTITAQQSGVSSDFKMPMPFVVNFEKGHAVVHLEIRGNETIAKKFHVPQQPVSVEANPWSAVLCTITE